jgi:hypothetical protein
MSNQGMTRAQRIVLVTIARNEADRIARLLASVRPWVDSMLVLDTGSDDDTAEIARQLGARVEQYEWSDDFSAARNVALDHAGGDWHLVLDADEWLAQGGEFLRQVRQQPADWAGQVRLDDVLDSWAPQGCVARNWLSRLLPGHLRYAGRIHEQPVHALPVRRTPLVIAHDGYRPDALVSKRGRNRRLLLRELQERPDDAYLLYQVGKDASVYEEHDLAHACLAAACERGDRQASWRLDLIIRWIAAMKHLGLHGQAAALAHQERTRYGFSPDFHFAVGDLMLDWTATAPDRTDDLLAEAEQAWRRCLAIGERPDVPGSVPGRGSHLAAFNLALLLEVTGRSAEACGLRRSHGLAEAALLS